MSTPSKPPTSALSSRRSAPGTNIPASTPPAQPFLVQVVITWEQLQALANQLNTEGPAGSDLANSIQSLQSLIISGVMTGSVPAQQQPGTALPAVALLVAKIGALRHVLGDLTRVDPSAAKRLASTLHVLHALLIALLRPDRSDTLSRVHLSGFQPSHGLPSIGAIYLDPAGWQPGVLPVRAATESAAPAAVDPSPQPAYSVVPARERAVHRHPSAPQPSPRAGSPRLAVVLRSATPASTSGALSAPAPATGAVVAAGPGSSQHEVSSARLDVRLAPWLSALLTERLDRPG